jgi:hypothetical protein
MAADHVARLEAEHRRDAAKIAVDKLGAEVSAARLAHDDARNALEVEARTILAREAEGVVERIAELEREAMQRRGEVEGLARSGVIGWGAQMAISAAGKYVLNGNQNSPIGIKNSPEWIGAHEAAERVRQRYASLLKQDPAPAESAA